MSYRASPPSAKKCKITALAPMEKPARAKSEQALHSEQPGNTEAKLDGEKNKTATRIRVQSRGSRRKNPSPPISNRKLKSTMKAADLRAAKINPRSEL